MANMTYCTFSNDVANMTYYDNSNMMQFSIDYTYELMLICLMSYFPGKCHSENFTSYFGTYHTIMSESCVKKNLKKYLKKCARNIKSSIIALRTHHITPKSNIMQTMFFSVVALIVVLAIALSKGLNSANDISKY